VRQNDLRQDEVHQNDTRQKEEMSPCVAGNIGIVERDFTARNSGAAFIILRSRVGA